MTPHETPSREVVERLKAQARMRQQTAERASIKMLPETRASELQLAADLTTVLAIISQQQEENERLRVALGRAADQFAGYAVLHNAKGTADGSAKAATNEAFSEMCRAALEQGAVR